MSDDGITLSGVPFYAGGRVPDGFASLIEDIAELEGESTPQEVAESIAEQAIARIFVQLREEEGGVRDHYKGMLDDIRTDHGREMVVNVRRTFGSIVNDHHAQFIEQAEGDGADEPGLDPSKCQYIKEDTGEQCGNDRPKGSDYCHAHEE